MKEDLQSKRDETKDYRDHADDKTSFEISIVNKRDMMMHFDCQMHNGDIVIDRVKVYEKYGL